jgi:valyl-tRNA synthetase
MDNYNFASVEKKWQNFFEKKKFLKPKGINLKNFFV